MYQAMTSLGFAAESGYKGPVKLGGDVKGASVLILGAGLAGMTAALELRKAGYKVQVLEFNSRPGGRNWTLRGGDSFTELGGFTQTCEFEQGLYFNPGPWRIPYHHRALLDYCKRLGVALEPFVQLNHNALLHALNAFGGGRSAFATSRPIFRDMFRRIAGQGDAAGQARRSGVGGRQGDAAAGAQIVGRAGQDYAYKANLISAPFSRLCQGPGRRPRRRAGGRRTAGLSDILKSRLWRALQEFRAV
jgi:monoamine oxidase